MKKLKEYKKCDFRFVEVQMSSSVLVMSEGGTTALGPGTGSGTGTDDFDAPEQRPFGSGVWDDWGDGTN